MDVGLSLKQAAPLRAYLDPLRAIVESAPRELSSIKQAEMAQRPETEIFEL